MKLQNPFPLSVRNLYIGVWDCWICGSNGTNRGGLELHHIKGRISASAFNSSLLCGVCHSHMGHNTEEEKNLIQKTISFLLRIKFVPSDDDWDFLKKEYIE